ncbi:MAG: acyltransferase family protein [Bacteroidetes bacterium]|nr:acyltransferase family protein [Bacteroidota bacterium]
MKRDLYIDFAKGFATLAIIFIHTAFWSGQFYIKTEFRVLSLLFDVPIFFALSGLTSGGKIEKTFYRLLKLQITYMIFVTFLFFLDYFFKVFGLYFFGLESLKTFYATFGTKYTPTSITNYPQWQNLGNWYLHQYTRCDTFPVVMGSFWYLKVYYILTVLGVLILRFFPKHIIWFIAICFGYTIFINLNMEYYPTGQVGYVAFYLGLFLLAHQMKGKILNKNITLALLFIWIVILGIIIYFFGYETIMKMNKAKFPPKMLYIFWASFSIVILFGLYNKLKIEKPNFITNIGNNAIFYYFAQGMSSSFIYFPVVYLQDKLPWYILMVLSFCFNIFLAVFLAKSLQKLDEYGWKILYKLKNISEQKNLI